MSFYLNASVWQLVKHLRLVLCQRHRPRMMLPGRLKYHMFSSSHLSSQPTSYNYEADKVFQNVTDMLESSDKSHLVEAVECSGEGVLKIALPKGQGIILLNQHQFCKQIWYSSPFGKPDYFDYADGAKWISSRTGDSLLNRLVRDLNEAHGEKNMSF